MRNEARWVASQPVLNFHNSSKLAASKTLASFPKFQLCLRRRQPKHDDIMGKGAHGGHRGGHRGHHGFHGRGHGGGPFGPLGLLCEMICLC